VVGLGDGQTANDGGCHLGVNLSPGLPLLPHRLFLHSCAKFLGYSVQVRDAAYHRVGRVYFGHGLATAKLGYDDESLLNGQHVKNVNKLSLPLI